MQGCVQRVFFGDVNAATVRVLAAEGWEVHAPRQPRCCGALQLHAGVEDEALALARETIAAYEGFDAIVVNVAGCGSAMKDYGAPARRRPRVGRARRGVQRPRSRDVHELLAEHEPRAAAPPARAAGRLPRRLPPRPRPGRPRSQPRELLRAIPGLELLEPAEWELCCGSAGIYNLVQPEAAAKLGARKADNLRATGAEAIAAANPGCALQIAAHLDGDAIPIYHPMTAARPLDPREPPDEHRCPTASTRAARDERSHEILSDDALRFVAELHGALRAAPRRSCSPRAASATRRCAPAGRSTSSPETRGDPRGRLAGPAAAPRTTQDRRVEITGPTDRKLVINALNSGAKGFMADFEDANSPDLAQPVSRAT